jgi:DNA-binding transcriptional regulator YbjK
MLDNLLRRETFKVLFDESRFKKAQLDALLVKRYAHENHLTLKEALSMRDKKTTLGSFERSASQAEGVISESAATIILALGQGLVSPSMVDAMPRVASIVEQSSLHKLDDDESARFQALLNAVLHSASHR